MAEMTWLTTHSLAASSTCLKKCPRQNRSAEEVGSSTQKRLRKNKRQVNPSSTGHRVHSVALLVREVT